MTIKQLEELERLETEATPGDWRSSRKDMDSYDLNGNFFVQIYADDPEPKMHMGQPLPMVVARLQEGDPRVSAALIVASRNSLKELIAMAKAGMKLREAINKMEVTAIACGSKEGQYALDFLLEQLRRVLKQRVAEFDASVGKE